MPNEKKDSSETLRTTDTMKRRAHLCSRFVITVMKLFRLCGKRKQKPKSKKKHCRREVPRGPKTSIPFGTGALSSIRADGNKTHPGIVDGSR